ncbi:hypothetical protein DH2020_000629 [Rehmannia glutinosa]|uniref:R2R3-MYB protein n=1 Tax=Rehmannia glutinosa TaxID=99300 RepID=A0ABR0XX14_REHGL
MRSPSLISSSKQTAVGGGSGKKAEATPCCSKVGLKRGPWTAEEDEMLAEYIKREGEGRWRTLPKKAGLLRCGKSCRLRWMNYLRPSVKRGHISPDEEDLILRLHRLLGNRWSLIAGRIPGRTDNEIKNYWNTHLSKKLISQGIDPKTHKPINPNPNPKYHVPIFDDDQNIVNINNIQHGDGTMIDSEYVHVDEDVTKKNSRNICDDHDEGIIMSINNEDEDHDDTINCCPDDAFSSFLNSLINDDMFINNQHDQEQDGQHSSCLI